MQRLAYGAFALVSGCAAIVIAATGGDLPDRVATSFSSDAPAGGWVARELYLGVLLASVVAAPALNAAMFRWWPSAAIANAHLPDRDYWLAPERREATLATLERYSCALGCLIVALFTAFHLLLVDAHASDPPHLSTAAPILMIVTIGGAVFGWLALVRRRFRRPG